MVQERSDENTPKKKIIVASCGSAGGVPLVLLILAACVLWCRWSKNCKSVSRGGSKGGYGESYPPDNKLVWFKFV